MDPDGWIPMDGSRWMGRALDGSALGFKGLDPRGWGRGGGFRDSNVRCMQASDIHASVKEKNQKRALFYDLSLVVNFKGSFLQVRKPPLKETTGEMVGVFRMYNIGQDTRFCPGGDKETSYMYELGFDRRYHGQCEQWAETIKEEAAELFHIIGPLLGKWQAELVLKSETVQ